MEGFRMKRKRLMPMLLTTILLASCGTGTPTNESAPPVAENTQQETEQTVDRWKPAESGLAVSHIHGAGFWQDGRPVIATHTGLMEYRQDGWYELTSNRHDYMGFELVADGLYASGHPEQDSPYDNPLGVVRGTDKGETLEIRSLEGEADFHYMSVGYESDSIYVYLEQPTSELTPGFYRSFDSGTSFEPMQMNGIAGASIAGITADATEAKRVFVYGPDGMLMSTDGGDHFEPMFEREQVVTATADHERIAYIRKMKSSYELVFFGLEDKVKEEQSLPNLSADELPLELAITDDRVLVSTSDNSVYLFEDGEWRPLLKSGT